jgi:hypothetical protein
MTDDDLTQELARAARTPWFNRGGVALAGLVLVIGGFLAGVQVQKAYGEPAGRGGNGATGSGLGAGRGGNFPGFGTGARAGAGTTGKVKLVDGTTVYVETADGTVVVVKTTDTTSVQLASKATVGQLKAGSTVTVQGPAGADGVVTATSVTQAAG